MYFTFKSSSELIKGESERTFGRIVNGGVLCLGSLVQKISDSELHVRCGHAVFCCWSLLPGDLDFLISSDVHIDQRNLMGKKNKKLK